jgi:nitrogen-specific signal transduction histidine kinase
LAERAEVMQQLLHAQKMDVLGRMTAGIAHDFNNLLAIIIGNNDMMLEDLANHDLTALNSYQQHIQIAAHRGVELIKKLMQYSRQTRPRSRDSYHNPFSQVERSQSMMRSVLPSSIELIYALQPVPDTQLDGTEVMQVLSNLMVNARDAINGTGVISVSLYIETVNCEQPCSDCNKPLTETQDHQQFVCISVSDNGCGISSEQRPRIFDPFFTTKSIDKGTGLGLSVISGIVHEVGGHIVVDSPTGRGTRFRVLLPSPALLDASDNDHSPKPKQTLLVVDDEPLYLTTLVNRLRKKGYAAQSYVDPNAALNAFSQCPDTYTAAIIDFNMPQMNGLRLAEQLLQIRADLPIAISSGQDIEIPKSLAVQLFPKPFQFDSFLGQLEHLP